MLTPERLARLPRINEVTPSPDGRWLAAAVARVDEDRGRFVHDLWRIEIDGSEFRQLTFGSSNDRAPRFRSDGALGFLSNRDPVDKSDADAEEERTQVWVLEGGAEPRQLTDEPVGVEDFRFARSAEVLVVLSRFWPDVDESRQRSFDTDRKKRGATGVCYRQMPVRHWDHWRKAGLHLVVHDEHGRRDLTPAATHEHLGEVGWDLSPDGTRVVLGSWEHALPDRVGECWLQVLDVRTGRTLAELGRGAAAWHDHPRFDPSGERLACRRYVRFADRAPRSELVLFDLDPDQDRRLAEDWDRAPLPQAWIDADRLLVSADDEATVSVFEVDIRQTGSSSAIRRLTQDGSHSSLDVVEGRSVVGLRSTLLSPPTPFRLDVAKASLEKLPAPDGWADVQATRAPQVQRLSVPGRGDDPVQTFLLTPPGPGPHPLLLWIHGGPINHFADGWHWRWNPLVMVEAGYAVALPNPRGSTGFGDRFMAEIWADWGGACFEDLMRVTDALVARDEIDETRTVAMGGSFGGYMTNWIGGQTDRFRALVTHASLFDLGAFYGSTDYPAFFGTMLGATPWSADSASPIEAHSPHRFVERWKSPTLVIHGEKDYRVPISEGLALFEALQAQGVQSELLVFEDENHWIRRPPNVEQWYRTVLDFLGRYVG